MIFFLILFIFCFFIFSLLNSLYIIQLWLNLFLRFIQFFYLYNSLYYDFKKRYFKTPVFSRFQKKLFFYPDKILRFIFKKALKSIFLFWDIFKSLFSTCKLSNKKFFINQCNLNFRFLKNSLYLRVSFCLLLFAPKK